jgi:hypothetical protein
MEISYDRIPEHMRSGAKLYIEQGIKPGSFLTAVLSNDLKEAVARGDIINQHALIDWAIWLVNECPGGAQGSPELVREWIKAGGLEGIRKSAPVVE